MAKRRTYTVPMIRDGLDASYDVTVDAAEALEAGVRALGAVRTGRGYAYRADETGEWYSLTQTEIATYGAGMISPHGVDYSLWCAGAGTPR